jgi:ribosome maturation factor RimP
MSQIYEKERQLHREVAETVESRLPGVEVLAVELGGPELLRVYIDHARGVDHALCEEVTGVLRGYLDRYSLEVSSPGLARPVRTRAHFERALGRRVNLRTAREVSGRKRFKGEVVSARDRDVTLVVADGERFDVPYETIVRGNLIDDGREP